MKSSVHSALVLGLFISSAWAQAQPDLTNPKQKNSYALGMDIISTLNQQAVDIDPAALAAGIADALAGHPILTAEQQKAAISDLSKAMAARENEQRTIMGAKNLKNGLDFLANNAKKDGIKLFMATAPDGTPAELQYQILKTGTGASPKGTDIVEVHYEINGIDGARFDSSARRGTPATFGIHDVMPGWGAALQKMKVGDKWRLFIPAKLGFGEFGPPQIPPNSTLICDLELLSFYTPTTTNSAAATSPATRLIK